MKKFSVFIFFLFTTITLFTNCTYTDHWSDFEFPTIDVVDEDKVSEGVLTFHRLVPNPDSLFRSCIIEVCKVLYKDKAEVPVKTAFRFNLRNSQGVAATGGNLTEIDMFINTNYIADFYTQHNNSDEETLSEITGIVIHELTHAYQHSPKGAGGYVNKSEHFSCIEGIADATRLKAGYVDSQFRRPGGHWNDGYKTTAFFIGWITSLDEDFIYKMNQSTLTITPWTWDKATNHIVGQPVKDLWIAYQKSFDTKNEKPVVDFLCADTLAVTDIKVNFKDQSLGNPFEWKWSFEGGIPASSNEQNPTVIYKKEGKYSVGLVITNAFGEDSVLKNNYVLVGENPAGVLISDLQCTILTQHDDSPVGEDISKLFDNSATTKFLTFNKSSWIELHPQTGEKFFLSKFCIVSANDSPQRDPKMITIKGSNDGKTWEMIDQHNSVAFAKRFQSNEFDVSTKEAYMYYRVELENNGGEILQVADMQIYGKVEL